MYSVFPVRMGKIIATVAQDLETSVTVATMKGEIGS